MTHNGPLKTGAQPSKGKARNCLEETHCDSNTIVGAEGLSDGLESHLSAPVCWQKADKLDHHSDTAEQTCWITRASSRSRGWDMETNTVRVTGV